MTVFPTFGPRITLLTQLLLNLITEDDAGDEVTTVCRSIVGNGQHSRDIVTGMSGIASGVVEVYHRAMTPFAKADKSGAVR